MACQKVYKQGRDDIIVKVNLQSRGGAGISKVVRLLQIKDHRRACTWGGEGVQQAMCGSENCLWNQIAWVQMQSAPGFRRA